MRARIDATRDGSFCAGRFGLRPEAEQRTASRPALAPAAAKASARTDAAARARTAASISRRPTPAYGLHWCSMGRGLLVLVVLASDAHGPPTTTARGC